MKSTFLAWSLRMALAAGLTGFIGVQISSGQLKSKGLPGLAVQIDKSSLFARSYEGGQPEARIVQQGTDKRVAGIEYVPLTLEFSSLTPELIELANQSWSGPLPRFTARVQQADAQGIVTHSFEYLNCVLAEFAVPKLDASDKKDAAFSLTLDPDAIRPFSGKVPPPDTTKQKAFQPSNFRVRIGDLDASSVAKVEAFVVKLRGPKNESGRVREYTKTPSSLEIPNLVFEVSAARAEGWLKWHHEAMFAGSAKEYSGAIDFLSPNLQSVIFSIQLSGLGMVSMERISTPAGLERQLRYRVELYCEKMTLK